MHGWLVADVCLGVSIDMIISLLTPNEMAALLCKIHTHNNLLSSNTAVINGQYVGIQKHTGYSNQSSRQDYVFYETFVFNLSFFLFDIFFS